MSKKIKKAYAHTKEVIINKKRNKTCCSKLFLFINTIAKITKKEAI